MKPRKKSKYTLLLLSLMVCFSVMIGVSTYMLLSAHAEYSEGEESYVDLLPYVSIPYAEQEPSASEETTPVSYTHLDVYKRQGGRTI